MTYTVLVHMISGNTITIQGVSGYKYNVDSQCFLVEKNGYNIMFNKDCVECIGREFDLENRG